MKERFNIDVKVNTEVLSINKEEKKVTVKKADGSIYEESYDDLIFM